MKITILYIAVMALSAVGHAVVAGLHSHISNTSSHSSSTPNLTHVEARPSSNRIFQTHQQDLVQTAGWNPDDVASPADIQKFAGKGGFLRCLLDMTDTNAGQAWPNPANGPLPSVSSPWKGTLERELRAWYWNEASYSQEHCYFGSEPGDTQAHHIGAALESLGLNLYPRSYGGHNTCYSIEHYDENARDDEGEVPTEEQYYRVNGQAFRATGSHYRFGINTIGGAIFAQMFESPLHSAKDLWHRTPTINELPALRLGSDILFAYWLRNNANPKRLRYYFVNHVSNEETLRLCATILNGRGYKTNVPSWPGVQVDRGSLEFDMLLGSPLGATLAFLLVQHKAELGVKRVTSIVIFQDDKVIGSYVTLHLLFKVADVVDPVGGAQDIVVARGDGGEMTLGGVVGEVRTHQLVW